MDLAKALLAGNANYAIASLPLTLLLSALPHWYTIYLAESNKVQGGWTNENPRAFVARLNAKAASGKKLSDLESMILRGQSAQQNGFEWWAVWAVAAVSNKKEVYKSENESNANANCIFVIGSWYVGKDPPGPNVPLHGYPCHLESHLQLPLRRHELAQGQLPPYSGLPGQHLPCRSHLLQGCSGPLEKRIDLFSFTCLYLCAPIDTWNYVMQRS